MEEKYNRLRRRILFSFILIGLVCFFNSFLLTAEEVWEGSAARIRKGEIDTEGFYAASNSFPQETQIEVRNLKTGDKVKVTIIKRLDNDVNIFLLLSQEAADALSIGTNEVARVSVRIVYDSTADLVAKREYLTYNPDPDVNPSIDYNSQQDTANEDTSDTATTDTVIKNQDNTKITDNTQNPDLPPDNKQTDTQQTDNKQLDTKLADNQETNNKQTDNKQLDTKVADNQQKNSEQTNKQPDTQQTDTRSVDTLDKSANKKNNDQGNTSLTEPRLAQVDTLDYTLMQKAQREPQKNLFQLPREGDVFVSLDSERPKQEKVTLAEMNNPDTDQPLVEEKALTNKKPLKANDEQTALNEPNTRQLDQKAVEDLQVKHPTRTKDEKNAINEPNVDKGKSDILPDTNKKKSTDTTASTFDLIPVEGLVEEDVPEVIVTVSEPDDKDGSLKKDTHEPSTPLVQNQEELKESDINALLDKQYLALSRVEPTRSPLIAPTIAITITPTPQPTVTAVLPLPTPSPTVVATVLPTPAPTQLIAKNSEGDGKLVLEPTNLKPPVETPAPNREEKIAKNGKGGNSEMNLNPDYTKGRIYFIQLAAYQEVSLAEKLKTAFSNHYPIEVYTAAGNASRSAQVFKVLIGPLNKDESGTILYRFQAMGFKDAFIKTAIKN